VSLSRRCRGPDSRHHTTDINRRSNASTASTSPACASRILIVSVSPDLSASYIPIMNSIFCAQKMVCTLPRLRSFAHLFAESHHRRLQSIRPRHCISTTSCPSHRWLLSLHTAPRFTLTIPNGTLSFSISARLTVADLLPLPSKPPPNHGRAYRRQGRLSSCLFLP
jgi:Transcription factor Tfb4